MTSIRKADEKDLRALSTKLLALLKDKESPVYQENVAKFGIPDKYVREAFTEKALLNAFNTGEAAFYLAWDRNEIIGFAQTIKKDVHTAQLDRIIVFPQNERRGVGTNLLQEAVKDQQKEGIDTVIVNTGKQETHARHFYEKNRFKQTQETTINTPWGKKLTLITYKLKLTQKTQTHKARLPKNT